MEQRTSRRDPARSPEAPRHGGAVSGPRSRALAGIAATLNAAPRVAQLQALSGVLQRVIAPLPDGLAAARQRLIAKGVPGEVVDDYQNAVSSFTEAEIELAHRGPFGASKKIPKQSSFPKLLNLGGAQPVPEDSLIFRGMSINNVKNLKQSVSNPQQVIFNAQNPQGEASAVQHIANDDADSPFLSFETGGYDISAGKYAPKPIGPDHLKPRGVARLEGGFLKQHKPYTFASKRDYPQSHRVGYFGGVDPTDDVETLDVSTPERAQQLADPNEQDVEKARKLAVADREILLKPGLQGVPRSSVPFIGKVKQVPKEYYDQKRKLQTATKALAFSRGKGRKVNEAEYFKLQIPDKYALDQPRYGFDIPDHLKRRAEDEGEISDVESMDLNLSDDDFSANEFEVEEDEGEQVPVPQILDDQGGGQQPQGAVADQVNPLLADQQQGADQQENLAQAEPLVEEEGV